MRVDAGISKIACSPSTNSEAATGLDHQNLVNERIIEAIYS